MAYWGTTAKLNEKKGQTALSLDNSALNVRDYDNERLNKKYSDTINLLNNLNKKTGANRDVIQDANSLMDEYIGTIKKSYNLNEGNLKKNYLTIGQSSFDKALKNMVWDYQYSNQTHEQYQQALQGLSYQPQSAITAKNQQNVIDLAKKKGLTGLTKEEEETARMYEDAARHGGNPGKLINGITGLTEATLTPDGQDMINPYRLDAKTREKYGKEAEALRAKGQITYDMADAYLKNDPAYAFAQDHAGDLNSFADQFEGITTIAEKAQKKGVESLTDQEQEVYYYAMGQMNDLEDIGSGKLANWGASYANELRGLNGVFSAYQPTDEQQFILKKDRETLEGARQWRDEAAGTAEEQQAEDNYWIVSKQAQSQENRERPDFDANTQPVDEYMGNPLYAAVAGKMTDNILSSFAVPFEQNKYDLAYMRPEEKGEFFWTWHNKGEKEAVEYLDLLQYTDLGKRRADLSELGYEISMQDPGNAFALNAFSLLENQAAGPLGAFDLYSQILGRTLGLSDKPLDMYSKGQQLSKDVETIRGEMDKHLADALEKYGVPRDITTFVNGALMDWGDSMVGGFIGKGLTGLMGISGLVNTEKKAEKAAEWIGAALTGSRAMVDAMQSAAERGGKDTEIGLSGLWANVFETLGEKVELKLFFENSGKLGRKKLIEKAESLLNEVFVNATQEGITETANILADMVIMGDKSNPYLLAKEYEKYGLSPDEAQSRAFSDMGLQIGMAAAGGGLIGVFSDLSAKTISGFRTRSIDKATGDVVKTETKDTLKTFSEQLGGKAAELGKEYDPKKASNKQTGELLRTIFGQLNGEYSDTLLDRIAVDLHDAGAGFDAARSIAKMMAGQELSPEEIQTLAKDQQAMQVMYETFGGGQKQERQNQKPASPKKQSYPKALDADGRVSVGPLPGYNTEAEETENGESNDTETVAEAVMAQATGAEMSEQQKAALDKYKKNMWQRAADQETVNALAQAMEDTVGAEDAQAVAEAVMAQATGAEMTEAHKAALDKYKKNMWQRAADQETVNALAQAMEDTVGAEDAQAVAEAVIEQATGAEMSEQQKAALDKYKKNMWQRAADQETVNALAQAMEETVGAEDAQAVAEAVMAQATGSTLTDEQKALLEKHKTEMVNAWQGEKARKAAKALEEQNKADAAADNAQAEMALFENDTAQEEPAQALSEAEAPAEGAQKKGSPHGRVVEVAFDGDSGAVEAKMEDGSTVPLADSGLSEEQQELAQEVADLPQDAQAAVTGLWNPGQSIKDLAQGFKRVFTAAAQGRNRAASIYGEQLTPEQRQAALEAGKAEFERTKEAMAAKTKGTLENLKKRGFFFRDLNDGASKAGGVYFARVLNRVSNAAAAQLSVIQKLAEEYGFQVRVYDTMDENGNYETGSNVINLALDAEGGMLGRTVSHELYHYVSEWSREAGDKLRSYVLNALKNAKGYDYEARVQQIMDQYQTETGQQLTREDAEEEMAAEGMLDALDTDEALHDLFTETKDKSLIERIRTWLSDMAKSIRAAIDSLAWNHPEVRALKDNADYFQGLADKFKAALEQASENYRASQRGLYADAAADPDVQAYTEAIKEKGITLEDAKAEADALASKLFVRAEKSWIEQHADLYEEGFEKAKAAMMEYAQGKTSMVKAFTDQGLFAPPQELFPALAYAGRQMAAFQNASAGENGTKLQIRADEQGPYVDVDVDQKQFDGLTMPEMQKKASEILRDKYVGKSFNFQNGVATMYGRDPQHYAYSKFPKNTKKRETKMRASAEFDNVLGISSYLRSEPTNKNHPEMINWDYYKTRFKFGNSPIYDFEIKVGNRKDGTTEIYDVYPWYEKGSTSNSGPTTDVARSSQTFENASKDIVTQPGNNVNGKLSVRARGRDAAYMQALDSGDEETAQRMVDEAAKAAGYTEKVYHGTPNSGFTQFRDWSFFTKNKKYADLYQRGTYSSMRGVDSETAVPGTYELYMNPGKTFDTRNEDAAELYQDIRQEMGLGELGEKGLPDWTDAGDIIDYIEENGLDYDTVVLDEGGTMGEGEKAIVRGISYVSKSTQVKSADPVTYDDNGNVIPLSERFNEGKPDIRFSLRAKPQNADTSEETKELQNKAVEIFGKTYNWNVTGYVLPDGTRLDFSGKREGSDGNYREEDHRAIQEAYGEDTELSGTEAMIDFMRRGAIRIMPESGGIQLQTIPTKAQLQALDGFISKMRGEVTIDIDDQDGNTVFSKDYNRGTFSRSIIAEIPELFEQAMRSNSDTARFHSLYERRAASDERQDRQALEEVSDDPELYNQMATNADTMAAWQMLRRLHRLTTGGGENALIQKGAFEKRLSEIVKSIEEKTGTKYGPIKLRNALRKIYGAMEQSEYSPGEILQYARDIMRQVLDASPGVLAEQDETTQEIISGLKNRKFYLTDDQKSEIRNAYGTINRFAQKNFGTLRIVKRDAKTASLEDVWREDLAPRLPGVFAEDTNPLDMPGILDAWLETAKEKKYAGEFGNNIGAYATDLALNAMLDFYDVPGALKTKSQIREEYREQLGEQALQIQDLTAMARNAVNTAREEYAEKYRQRIEKAQERRQETERKQQLRKKITRDVRAISSLNTRNSDTSHVPQEMQAAALKAVEPFLAGSGVFNGAEMIRLSREYKLLEERKGEVGGFDEDILTTINGLPDRLNGRRLSELTEAELKDLSDIMGNLRKLIADANEAFLNGRKTTVDALSGRLKSDMREKGKAGTSALAKMARQFRYLEETPVYFADRVGGVIKEMINDFFTGESEWANIMDAAIQYKDEMLDKYHVKDWINDKEHARFVTQHGDQIELNKQEALTLYAQWKREQTNRLQNAFHLRVGGFMYGKGVKYEGVDTMSPHPLTESDMQMIRSYLTDEQMAFADAMVKYLSEDMSKLGNEVSMRLYGYEKYTEPYYFPYSTDKRYLVSDLTQNGGEQVKQPKSKGFTKALMQNAATPLTVDNFMDMWGNHVNEMALYKGFAEAVDTMSRVFNQRVAGEIMVDSATGKEFAVPPESNWIEMEKALGEEGVRYLKTLVRDISGGVRADERGNIMSKGLSLFKKSAVLGNLSVVLQQHTAYARAMDQMSPVYLNLVSKETAKLPQNIKEMYQYSGVAKIKRMGRFDTNTGKTAIELLTEGTEDRNAAQKVLASIDKVAGIGAEKADEWTWGLLWGAVKKETEHTHPELEKGSDAFLQEVARRFDEICRHTQVYDSVMSKSTWMRSNTLYDKAVTSFMAEPTLSLNMLLSAMQKAGQPGGGRKIARAAGTYVVSSLLMALAKSIATATRRKKDEGRTWLEKYVAESAGNFLDEISPFGLAGMIPYVRDILSLFEGYDVARSDMDAWEQLVKGFKTMQNYINGGNVTLEDAIQNTLGPVANMFGIPVKNVYRDTEAVIRNLFGGASADGPTTGRDLKYSVLENLQMGPISLYDSANKAYYDRMEQALISGDMAKYEELRGYLEDTKQVKPNSISNGVKNEIKESFERGLISDDKAMKLLQDHFGKDHDKAWEEVEKWRQNAAHADDEEYNYSKYREVLDLVKAGGDIKAAAKKLTDNTKTTESTVNSQIKSAIGEWYRNGEITQQQATEKMRKYLGITDEEELHWLFDKWDYMKSGEEENYSKFVDVFSAVKAGKDLTAAMKEMTDNGYEEKEVRSEIKSQLGKWYKAGEMNKSQAESKLKQYAQITDANDLYWVMDQWDYEKANPKGKYAKYNQYYAAIERGDGLTAETKRYMDHGVDKDTMSRQITSQYKPQYVALVNAGKTTQAAELKARILRAYEVLGYDRNKKIKDIDKWLKDQK